MLANKRRAKILRRISLTLAACLVFLVPFDAYRNVEMQGLLVLVAGGFAGVALLYSANHRLQLPERRLQIILGVLVGAVILSTVANQHLGYDVFGAPYLRLGAGGLLACMLIGALGASLEPDLLLVVLYVLIFLFAVTSALYAVTQHHPLVRLGGLASQADITACLIGCGLIIGTALQSRRKLHPYLLSAGQVVLTGGLIATETRAVMWLTPVLAVVYLVQTRRHVSQKLICLYAVVALSILLGTTVFMHGRLSNVQYASDSLSYRLTLQKYGLQAAWHRPWLGYGLGNTADALSCSQLRAAALQQTCRQGYFSNSSHNIFLDRSIDLGWIGGLSYFVIFVTAVYRAWRSRRYELIAMAYCLLLLGAYYTTNVTSVALELLLWIFIMQSVTATGKTKP